MKNLIKMAIVAGALVGFTACGGESGGTSGEGANSGGTTTGEGTSSVSINEALKGKHTINLHMDVHEDFAISPDGTKMYSIGQYKGDNALVVDDMTQLELDSKGEPKTFKNISVFKIKLPYNTNDNIKANQNVGSIALSPDGKTAYVTTFDSKASIDIQELDLGSLMVIDISNPKSPKIINKDTLRFFFHGLRVAPNGMLLAATGDTEKYVDNLTLIDVQDPKHPQMTYILKDINNDKVLNLINDIAISSDSKRAYVALSKSTAIIQIKDNTLSKVQTNGDGSAMIAITKDRKRMYRNDDLTNVQVYNVEDDDNGLIDEIETYTSYLLDMLVSADEKRLYVLSQSNEEGRGDRALFRVYDISNKGRLVFKKNISTGIFHDLIYAPIIKTTISHDGKKFYIMNDSLNIINLEE